MGKPLDVSWICTRVTANICYQKVKQLQPDRAEAYEAFADTMQTGSSTRQNCYLGALKRDPSGASVLIKLADTILDNQEITLPGGKVAKRQDLYLMAIELEPKIPSPIVNSRVRSPWMAKCLC